MVLVQETLTNIKWPHVGSGRQTFLNMLREFERHDKNESTGGTAGPRSSPTRVCPCEVISMMVTIATGTPPW